MTFQDTVAANQVLLAVTTKTRYNETATTIQSELNNLQGKVGYITVNRPFKSILDSMARKGLGKEKFFFVDAITATVQTPPVVSNCIFISSPNSLTDIGLAFTSLLTEKGCDMVFFDTISTLAIYQDTGSVIKFVHNLVTKTRVTSSKVVLLALKEDSEELIKDLNMFVDSIIEL